MPIDLKKDFEERLAKLAGVVVKPRPLAVASENTAFVNSEAQIAEGCAMKRQRPCCQGLGYKLEAKGAHICAEVCNCVIDCPECFGRARLVREGISSPCTLPSPVQIANMMTAAEFPAKYLDATLDRFNNVSGNGKQTLAQLRSWLARVPRFSKQGRLGADVAEVGPTDSNVMSSGAGLVLGGGIGIGKTYLLVALGKELVARGFTVRYCEFCQLLGDLKAGYSEGDADASLLKPLIDVDILIIDELGKGRNTDWEKTIADNLVTGRYNQNKLILAATNFQFQYRAPGQAYNIDLERELMQKSEFSPEQFGGLESRVGQRIFSRLQEMTQFIELKGSNMRKRGQAMMY